VCDFKDLKNKAAGPSWNSAPENTTNAKYYVCLTPRWKSSKFKIHGQIHLCGW